MLAELLAMMDALKEDIFYSNYNGELHVTVFDFDGFDDEWEEVSRNYTNEEGVYDLLEWLEQNCVSRTGSYYVTYHFPDFTVELGYSSMDI